MERVGYEKVLKQIEQRSLNEAIGFLRSIPLFSKWNSRSLAKLKYYFTKKLYHFNSIVFHAGEIPKAVYIVKAGEFEISCKIPTRNPKQDRYDAQYCLYHTTSKPSSTLLSKIVGNISFLKPQIKRNLNVFYCV